MTSVFTPDKDLRGRLLSAFASGAADRVALMESLLSMALALRVRLAGLFLYTFWSICLLYARYPFILQLTYTSL
jgi:hypothetical protein